MKTGMANRVLLVSWHAPWAPAWADVETSAQAALDSWRKHRHRYVFADLGDLGGMTGARFAMEVRKQDPQRSVVIVLMVDVVQPPHVAWASRSGANNLIERNLEAMTAVLPPDLQAELAGADESVIGASHALSIQAIAATVESQLQLHSRMGPVRSIVVADAIYELVREHPGVAPTVLAVARRAALQIASPADREAFLNSFLGDGNERA